MAMLTSEELASVQATLDDARTQTVQVLVRSAGAEDVFGNPADSYAAPVSYTGLVVPVSAQEVTEDRETQISDRKLRLPYDAVISGRDRVVCEGVTYEVVGPPERHQAPGGVTQTTVTIRQVEGT